MYPNFSIVAMTILIFLGATISILAYNQTVIMEKKAGFECGFNSLLKSKTSFSTKFFLIMILFLVFDLEVAVLLPSCMAQSSVLNSFLLPAIFIITLTMIMIMEWMNGIIEWSS